MELNIFKSENNESNDIVEDLIQDLTNFLNNNSKKIHNEEKINKEIINENNSKNKLKEPLSNSNYINSQKTENNNQLNLKQSHKLEQNLDRIEGHLYLVTSEFNVKIYLWDFTDKPEHEFEEKELPKSLLNLAKEGSLLQFKNGTYEFYSDSGYDLLFEEE